MRLHMLSEQSLTDVCIPAAVALVESSSLPLERTLLKPDIDTAVQTCMSVSEANAATSASNWFESLFMLER